MKRIATAIAGLIGALVVTLWFSGLDVPNALKLIYEGAFTSPYALSTTALRFTPMCLTSVGIAIAWRAKLFNIGGEGQYLMGGVAAAAAYVGVRGLPPALITPILLAAGFAGGALWAGLAGWLYTSRNVQVAISTILMNFVAAEFLAFCVRGPLQHDLKQIPVSQSLPNDAMLLRPIVGQGFHVGFFIALASVALLWLFFERTRLGFLIRVVGENAEAARVNRIPVASVQIRAMALSGGVCGLAAAITYAGVTSKIGDGFGQNWGFLAIPIALIGGLNPAGIAAVSGYFGVIFAGAENLQRYTPIGSTIVMVVQAVAVLVLVALESRRKATQGEANV